MLVWEHLAGSLILKNLISSLQTQIGKHVRADVVGGGGGWVGCVGFV